MTRPHRPDQVQELIVNDDPTAALGVVRQQIETDAQVIDINMDKGVAPEPDRRPARPPFE
ncbi:B12-dependent methionine synthase [compost metagenome]